MSERVSSVDGDDGQVDGARVLREAAAYIAADRLRDKTGDGFDDWHRVHLEIREALKRVVWNR